MRYTPPDTNVVNFDLVNFFPLVQTSPVTELSSYTPPASDNISPALTSYSPEYMNGLSSEVSYTPETGGLAVIDFENNDFSEWSSVDNHGWNPSLAYPIHGNYGLRSYVREASYFTLTKLLSQEENTLYVRFYFKIHFNLSSDDKQFCHILDISNSSNGSIAKIGVIPSTTYIPNTLGVEKYGGSGPEAFFDGNLAQDQAYCVEIKLTANNNITIWVDGVEFYNNDNLAEFGVDTLTFGTFASWDVIQPMDDYVGIDTIKIDTQPIGLYSSSFESTTNNDTLSLSDSSSLAKIKTGGDTLSLSDSSSLTKAKTITNTDTLSISDSISSLDKVKNITNTDTLSLSDSSSLVKAQTITNTDTLSISDSSSLTKVKTITNTDTLSLSDSSSLAKTNLVTDTLSLSDSSSLAKARTIGVNDNLYLSDSLLLLKAMPANDSATLSDVLISLVKTNLVTDTLSLSDSSSLV